MELKARWELGIGTCGLAPEHGEQLPTALMVWDNRDRQLHYPDDKVKSACGVTQSFPMDLSLFAKPARVVLRTVRNFGSVFYEAYSTVH